MSDQEKFAVLVTGSREWDDGRMISDRLSRYPDGTILIHGDAKGADRLSSVLSNGLKMVEVKVPYIGWMGKSGGQARNNYMLAILLGFKEQERSVRVEAFHDDLKNSKGTIGMMRMAKKAGVSVKLNKH